MALVVEDGQGLLNANAYADLAFISTWMDDRGYTAWEDREDQEALIIQATDFLDAQYEFHGYRRKDDQRLSWPRTGYFIRDGEDIPLDYDVVPDRIKEATAQAAYYAMTDQLFAKDEREIKQISQTVGPLNKSVTYSDGAANRPTFPLLDRLLKDYIRSSGAAGMAVVVRA